MWDLIESVPDHCLSFYFLKFGRLNMLSRLSSLSISSLRKLGEEANKFYDRKHDLYEAALLTRCYTQLFVRILILK